jgi:hypothetical protein
MTVRPTMRRLGGGRGEKTAMGRGKETAARRPALKKKRARVDGIRIS